MEQVQSLAWELSHAMDVAKKNNNFLSISGPINIQNQDADYNGALIHSYRAYTLSLGAFLFTIISSSVALYGKPT